MGRVVIGRGRKVRDSRRVQDADLVEVLTAEGAEKMMRGCSALSDIAREGEFIYASFVPAHAENTVDGMDFWVRCDDDAADAVVIEYGVTFLDAKNRPYGEYKENADRDGDHLKSLLRILERGDSINAIRDRLEAYAERYHHGVYRVEDGMRGKRRVKDGSRMWSVDEIVAMVKAEVEAMASDVGVRVEDVREESGVVYADIPFGSFYKKYSVLLSVDVEDNTYHDWHGALTITEGENLVIETEFVSSNLEAMLGTMLGQTTELGVENPWDLACVLYRGYPSSSIVGTGMEDDLRAGYPVRDSRARKGSAARSARVRDSRRVKVRDARGESVQALFDLRDLLGSADRTLDFVADYFSGEQVDDFVRFVLKQLIADADLGVEDLEAYDLMKYADMVTDSKDDKAARQAAEDAKVWSLEEVKAMFEAGRRGHQPDWSKTKEEVIAEAKSNVKDSKDDPRSNFIFPADSTVVNDGKGHYPINTVARGRAALSMAARTKTLPEWYSGEMSLDEFKRHIQTEVQKAFPSINVNVKDSGMSDAEMIKLLQDSPTKEDLVKVAEELRRQGRGSLRDENRVELIAVGEYQDGSPIYSYKQKAWVSYKA